jgi:hypothetical protein
MTDNTANTVVHTKLLSESEFNALCRQHSVLKQFLRHKFECANKHKPYAVVRDFIDWCLANCSDFVYINVELDSKRCVIYFLSEEDATHFKLVYCGK